MKLIEQKGPHCLAASAAMLFHCSIQDIWTGIGHKGTEDVAPDVLRGIHPQEIMDYAWERDIQLRYVEMHPYMENMGHTYPVWDKEKAHKRFMNLLMTHCGILMTYSHAVAWDTRDIFDPKGRKYHLGRIHDQILYALLI